MQKFLKQKNRGFTRSVGFGDVATPCAFSVSPKSTAGFTLVETLVAISIFSTSILALIVVLGQGIANTNYAKTKIMATYLAQEGIEYIRNMRDTGVLYDTGGPQVGWDNFKSNLVSCYAVVGCNIKNLNANTGAFDGSGFLGIINVVNIGSNFNEVKVTSTVSWTQGSGAYKITFSENLFNWLE